MRKVFLAVVSLCCSFPAFAQAPPQTVDGPKALPVPVEKGSPNPLASVAHPGVAMVMCPQAPTVTQAPERISRQARDAAASQDVNLKQWAVHCPRDK